MGTTNPLAKLDVAGGVRVVQGGRVLSLGDGNYSNHINVDSNVDFAFNYNNGGTGGLAFFGGTSTAKFMCSYTGTLTVAGDMIAYGSPSDITLKTNIKPIQGALETISKLQGVSFTWKDDTDANKMTGIKDDLGFIAQQVQEVLPDLVRKNDNGLLSLRDKGIIPVLVEAIKELKAEIDILKQK